MKRALKAHEIECTLNLVSDNIFYLWTRFLILVLIRTKVLLIKKSTTGQFLLVYHVYLKIFIYFTCVTFTFSAVVNLFHGTFTFSALVNLFHGT